VDADNVIHLVRHARQSDQCLYGGGRFPVPGTSGLRYLFNTMNKVSAETIKEIVERAISAKAG
jgi:hypothetical protein